LANDLGIDKVFEEPLSRKASKDDILVAISSSGNSTNILRAAETGRKAGMFIITLTGMNSNNKLRQKGDLNFWAPAQTYGFTEAAHAAILHYWVDWTLSEFQGKD
jgi:D-sedoheptulose 7-phosphate isomerase